MVTSLTSPTSLVGRDTAARIALACAGVSGDASVTVGVETFGGAAAFVAAVHDGDQVAALSPMTRRRIRTLGTVSRVIRALEVTRQHGLQVLTPEHELWPAGLAGLRGAAPLVLWVRGDARILTNPALALTGTAAATSYGIHMGVELSTGLAQRGWVIAAGAGSGIDQIALRGADAMRGRSLVVASPSLDRIRSGDARQVQVSELPPGMPLTVRAQRRSKHLLAALTVKTVIVEAGLSSGALRVAEAAHAIGRPVGVVPGKVSSPFSSGCHYLAQKHGVRLVTSILDADRLR